MGKAHDCVCVLLIEKIRTIIIVTEALYRLNRLMTRLTSILVLIKFVSIKFHCCVHTVNPFFRK